MQNLTTVTPENFGDIERIEYQGQFVLTTAQLAKAFSSKGDHVVTVNALKNNFNNNRDRFIEGKHYFKLEGDELRTFKDYVKIFDLVDDRAPNLYLWTKRGVARHCKSVGTDVAWEVFEALEDNYFERPAVKHAEFVALEREKFIVANSEETKTFAKAQLLRELASASGDNQSMRKKFLQHAAKLLIGEDFCSESNPHRV